MKTRLWHWAAVDRLQELEDVLGFGLAVGKFGAVVEYAEEGGVPGQVGQDHDAGLAVGRVSTEAERPLGVDVGQHEGEVAHSLDGHLRRVGELRRRLQHFGGRVRVGIFLEDERLFADCRRHRDLQIALKHPMDIAVGLESRTHFASR